MAKHEAGSGSPVVRQIDKQFLVCSICLDRYHNPKISSEYRSLLRCHGHIPVGHDVHSCREKGVSALQNNFFITNLMEVLQRDPECSRQEACSVLESVSAAVAGTPLCCPNHEGKVMEFYCESCETAMCLDCTEAEHREHVTVPLRDVLEQHKAALKTQLDAIRSRLPQLTAAIELVTEISRQLTEGKNQAVAGISSTFEELERALHQRKNALITDLESICSAKQKVLQAQLTSLLQGAEHIQSSCGFTEQALSHGSSTEVLLVQKQMSERVAALARHDFPEKPHQNAHLDCQVETDGLRRSIQNLGVLITTAAVAHTSVATGEGLRHATTGQQQSVTVTTKDKRHTEQCSLPYAYCITCMSPGPARTASWWRMGNAVLRAEITCPGDGSARAEPDVTTTKNGTYEVGYVLRARATSCSAWRVYGQPIRGSPFRLRALKPSDVPPSPDDVKRRVKSPSGSGGHVGRRRCAGLPGMYSTTKKKENPIEDELIYRVGVAGSSRGPTGVSVDMNGDIVVADYDNRWVSIFSSDGKFKNKIGAGRLMGPKGVAVDRNGHIITVDNKACCVFIFQSNGKLVNKFGSRGTSERQFAGPHFVAVNNKNEIIVTDFHNHSVKVYNADGEFLFRFGSHGEGNGQFNAPTGVAVDANGNIIVADWGNSRIQ
ncbi:hypothetical protein CRUP_035144, partial [Coryphaenoides rupestris]